MTYTKQNENLAKTFHDLEDTVTHQDDMIKDLVRLIRMQNSEINTILQEQANQAQEQEREQRRLSGIVDELSGRLSLFLNEQSATDANKKIEDSDTDLISSLIAKVDALDATLREDKSSKQDVLQGQIDALESKIDNLQSQMPSTRNSRRTDEQTKGLNPEDLQLLTESLAKRQLSMQFQVDTLAETLNRQIDMKPERNSAMSSSNQIKRKPVHESKPSTDMHNHRGTNSIESTHNPHKSPSRHSRIPIDDDSRSFSSLEFDSCHARSHASTSLPSMKEQHDDGVETDLSLEPLQRQITWQKNKAIQQDTHLASHHNDILNLKRRLAHAEKLIGARYRTGSFVVQGRSFYQDATSLRYIASDKAARDAFKMFYGNRLHAVEYVDIAPPAVLAAFDIIARVRCRHEMWTDDTLEVKQQIRCTVEKIVDDWMQSLLPLYEGEGHGQAVLARQLQREFNFLKVLCHRNGIDFDFALPGV